MLLNKWKAMHDLRSMLVIPLSCQNFYLKLLWNILKGPGKEGSPYALVSTLSFDQRIRWLMPVKYMGINLLFLMLVAVKLSKKERTPEFQGFLEMSNYTWSEEKKVLAEDTHLLSDRMMFRTQILCCIIESPQQGKSTSVQMTQSDRHLYTCFFQVQGLKEGESYVFRVRAINQAGVGKPSDLAGPVVAETRPGGLLLFC